jgi:DNA-binding NarL/FixJ family response regulator
MVVDDHAILRGALISMFKYDMDFEVIAHASNGKKALSMIPKVRPDIVLLDINMPVMNGREALIEIKRLHPNVKVVMLTMYNDFMFQRQYMELGAYSFVPKETPHEDLYKILRSVYMGNYYYLEIDKEVTETPTFNASLQTTLTYREQEIVRMLCNNTTFEEIAKTLKISVNTVKWYRKEISTKTLTQTLADLVKYAIRNGIISLE